MVKIFTSGENLELRRCSWGDDVDVHMERGFVMERVALTASLARSVHNDAGSSGMLSSIADGACQQTVVGDFVILLDSLRGSECNYLGSIWNAVVDDESLSAEPVKLVALVDRSARKPRH